MDEFVYKESEDEYVEVFESPWEVRFVRRGEVAELDGAMHSVWLHGRWRWLTSKMTTPQREAAAEAVERYSRSMCDEYNREFVAAASLAWWRPDYREEG